MNEKTIELPPDLPYGVRSATIEDLEATVALVNACALYDGGVPELTTTDLRQEWQTMEVARQTRLIVDGDGALVAYVELMDKEPTRISVYGCVAPLHRGRGLGSAIVRWTEEAAYLRLPAAPAGARVSIGNWSQAADKSAAALFANMGYALVRRFWRMEIAMEETPPTPVFPHNVVLRTFQRGQDDRAVFEALEESFSDHWGHLPGNFEEFRHHRIDVADLDPTLWLLAMDGDEIAGFSLCSQDEHAGWVHMLGVRRAWRRRRLGRALLHASFTAFYARGMHTVKLGVDAASLTGATHLYEKGGMHVTATRDRYEKELRAGRELSIQALPE